MLRALPKALAAGVVALLTISSCGERPGQVEEVASGAPVSSQPETVREVLYRCNSGRQIAARYLDGGGQASRAELLIDGEAYGLLNIPAASGALYATDEGRSPGRGLHWHTQGPDAALTETLTSEPAAAGVPVDSCSEQPESHAEAE